MLVIVNIDSLNDFSKLILSIIKSKDNKKLEKISLGQIKGTIETFSIKEEKFINEIYHVKMNVSFDKKSIFDILESKNIFPSLPVKKNIVFIPIIIDDNKINKNYGIVKKIT